VALPIALAALSVAVWRDAGAQVSIASVSLLCALVVLLASKMMSAQYVVWVLALTALVVDDHISSQPWPRWPLAVVATTAAP
jgi:hypothetical protein